MFLLVFCLSWYCGREKWDVADKSYKKRNVRLHVGLAGLAKMFYQVLLHHGGFSNSVIATINNNNINNSNNKVILEMALPNAK